MHKFEQAIKHLEELRKQIQVKEPIVEDDVIHLNIPIEHDVINDVISLLESMIENNYAERHISDDGVNVRQDMQRMLESTLIFRKQSWNLTMLTINPNRCNDEYISEYKLKLKEILNKLTVLED